MSNSKDDDGGYGAGDGSSSFTARYSHSYTDPRAMYASDFDTGDVRLPDGTRIPKEMWKNLSAEQRDRVYMKMKFQRDQDRKYKEKMLQGFTNNYAGEGDGGARSSVAAETAKEPESTVPDGPIKPRMPELDL